MPNKNTLLCYSVTNAFKLEIIYFRLLRSAIIYRWSKSCRLPTPGCTLSTPRCPPTSRGTWLSSPTWIPSPTWLPSPASTNYPYNKHNNSYCHTAWTCCCNWYGFWWDSSEHDMPSLPSTDCYINNLSGWFICLAYGSNTLLYWVS